MHVALLGINHKSADLAFREQLAKVCQKVFGEETSFQQKYPYVLLSTCNRTEIYFSSKDLIETHSYILHLLREEILSPFESKLYSYFNCDCFTHLALVTSGFDSAILGETEIQGQVKNAYQKALLFRKLPAPLHFLFQKSLKIGKDIRSQFKLEEDKATLADALLQLTPTPQTKKILFVGASKINYEVIKSFKEKGLNNLHLSNRSHEPAVALSKKQDLTLLPWKQLNNWHHYDAIIFGTKSPTYLITPQDLPTSSPSSSRKVIFDLCVPRNVDPQIELHQMITLYNIDQVDRVVQQNRCLKSQEIFKVEKQILETVRKQISIFEKKNQATLASATSS